MARLCIGTSGFHYDWPRFYAGAARKRRLEHYAARLNALEINGSFYRLQNPEVMADWRRRTPPDFVFTMKVHRFLTHNKKLKDLAQPIENSKPAAEALGDKLRVMLWQLPAALRANPDRLRVVADLLSERWSNVRHAFEFRHATWFTDEVAEILAGAGLACCLSDAPDFPLWDAVTTDLVYVRLHGHTRKYASRYTTASLERWAERIRTWRREGREVHVYFDNDAEGHAPHDALRLAALLGGGG